MRIIQNLACIEVVVNPDDNKIIIKKDILKDKKINSMFIYGSNLENVTFSPFTGEYMAVKDDIKDLNLYLNLTDKDKNQFVKDFCIDPFSTSSESNKFLDYDIERVINHENIVLTSKSYDFSSLNILLYVIYQNDNIRPSTDEINGSISVTYIPSYSDNEDIKLKDIIGYLLNDKPIKAIQCNLNTIAGYLDLRSKNGKRIIENIPLNVLALDAPSGFEFDPFIIDTENSYLRMRGLLYDNGIVNESKTDTKITFIY